MGTITCKAYYVYRTTDNVTWEYVRGFRDWESAHEYKDRLQRGVKTAKYRVIEY